LEKPSTKEKKTNNKAPVKKEVLQRKSKKAGK
jgi:hypothetical protein